MSDSLMGYPELVTMGETMALLTHRHTTPLRHARSLELSVGGSESNVAIAATRLGVATAWAGRVGDDELGRMVVRELRAEGVRAFASVDPSKPTAIMLKSPRTSQSTHVTYYRSGSAGSALGPDDVNADLLRNARVFHTSAITPALSATALDAVHKSIEICRTSDTLVSVDLNFRRALWSEREARDEFRFLASKADIVFATEGEARVACDAPDATSLARELASLGGGSAVVKRGELGAVAYVQGQVHVVEAVPVMAVDSVGAGDAFAGGFLAALIRGHGSSQSLRWAALMGAWSVATDGDWQGLPTLDELESLQNSSDDVTR
ncbi:sugar kinase [Micromonospora sp. ATA32]|uniref:sugar kinase n=1 Tax=Micromonospora sp. NPDC005087 TaxID=3364225 RepID=UPI001A41941A|nr:sugar kinase [Micromonospora sp. ATA32]